MSKTSVIQIEVSDQQFKSFYELFQHFQSDIEELPESWKTVGEASIHAQQNIAKSAELMDTAMMAAVGHAEKMAQHLREASHAQKHFVQGAIQGEGVFHRLGKEAKSLKDTLLGIGGFLTKLGVLGIGTFTGALFGMDRLAQAAVGTQRQARAVGMTSGQLRAFRTDLGSRYLDESILSSIAKARTDLTGRVWLSRALGLPQQSIEGMDTGTLAGRLALRAHDWWASTPASQHNETFYQTTGLAQSGLSFEAARQQGNTNRSELVRALAQYQHDRGRLGFSDRSTDALYGFERKLRLAGQDMETYFIRKLAELGPHLGAFITVLTKDARKLLDEVLTPANLDRVEKGLDDLGTYLASGQFLDALEKVTSAVGDTASAFGKAAGFIAGLLPDTRSLPGETKPDGTMVPGDASAKGYLENYFLGSTTMGGWAASKAAAIHAGDNANDARQQGSPAARFYNWYSRLNGFDPMTGKRVLPYNKADASALFSSLERGRGLPSGILASIAQQESNFNPLAVSRTGNKGIFQLGDDVAKNLGVNDPYDWQDAAMGAAKLLQQLQSRYHGDLSKELAAWNWNPSAVDMAIKNHPGDWQAHLPNETQGFLKHVLKNYSQNGSSPPATQKEAASQDVQDVPLSMQWMMQSLLRPRMPQVNIHISNPSGTNVAVSSNAAAIS